ncbi:hypothetical protein LNV23_23750 [Paucibacter sp. DJ1R-11]|uniref:hypothetical protein n=1 Tax=Paucibacter sp. DJ1R-11 TaxID=2893556 RepID=UPI0021E48E4D|nr:hypothetical protein [Paucibacter sp. DJ1R-11]MCV2366451.1 hypothetical protein [Paucibacter sp. DJ1R-11]
MQTVELIRAEVGAKKVSCTTTLQAHCGLGLAAAKKATDALLEKKCPRVSLQSVESARSLIVSLAGLGVVARFAEGPNYNPQERLTSALATVQALLEPETLRTCESLSAHGEWELALSHCLAHLSMRTNATTASAVKSLGQLAIEFGIVGSGQK